MAIAFFDLDKTILARNSGAMWVKAELRGGHVTWAQAAKAMWWIGVYHLGAADLGNVLRDSVNVLKGQLENDVRDRALAFYEREVKGLVRPGAHAALEKHRSAGDGCWMLTTSSSYLSEAVARQLEMDGSLCSHYCVDPATGMFTGEPKQLCFGPGKVDVAREFAEKHGVRLAECAFYSDSTSDLPMLEAVGRPVAVNPDPKLRRIAARRGWEIADWGVPG